jgi:hypothetical protein
MISYEELVAALDRYVARNGGTPQSVHAPAGGAVAPAYTPPEHDVAFDEHHDPDLLSHGGEEDATHVGASPAAAAPSAPAEDHSNEIDIGDVLADDELS